VNNEDF